MPDVVLRKVPPGWVYTATAKESTGKIDAITQSRAEVVHGCNFSV